MLIGATTENPFFSVNSPLLSRATLWRLEPLDDADLAEVVRRGLETEQAQADEDAVAALVSVADGDARAALGTLEVALALAGGAPSPPRWWTGPGPAGSCTRGPTPTTTRSARSSSPSGGRTPTPALYWLARMLEAGEDARFIARRLVILASEDVGLADPLALVVADAAARAVEFVGLPEAQLNLAQAVIYLAAAPKSNRVTTALGRARADARDGPRGEVPGHLRDARYRGAKDIGHGEGYRYPHDDPRGWVEQDYRPAQVADHVYYEPSDHGAEAELAERLRRRRGEAGDRQDGED